MLFLSFCEEYFYLMLSIYRKCKLFRYTSDFIEQDLETSCMKKKMFYPENVLYPEMCQKDKMRIRCLKQKVWCVQLKANFLIN